VSDSFRVGCDDNVRRSTQACRCDSPGGSIVSEAGRRAEVSVIVPCHNSTRTLGLQLEALAHQVGAPPLEVIVADNGSSDGLDGFLDDWRDRLTVRYVVAGGLQGAAYARNVGMSVAAADKLLFCDSDDVVARDWVAQGSAALDAVDVFSGPGRKATEAVFQDSLCNVWNHLDRELVPGAMLERRREVAWPIVFGANFGMRRSLALELGGFDAGLSRGIEDNDLAVRVQRSGRTIAIARGSRILYRSRSTSSAAFRQSREAGEWHMALCERYGLCLRSPHLRGGWWWLEMPRCVLSGVRMVVVPSRRDWKGLASRVGLALGMWRGWWRFRVAHKLPDPAVGVGLREPASRRGRAVVFMPGVLSGGGAERYAVATAAALANLGFAAVLATTDTHDGERIGRNFGVDLSRVQVVEISGPPTWLSRLPHAVFSLAEEAVWLKAVRALRPALFVNCLYRSELVGVGERNIYVCHFPHRLDETYSGALRRAYMALMGRARTRLLRGGKDFRDTYDLVCANSHFTAGHIRKRWGVEPRVLYPPCPPMDGSRQKKARQILVVGRVEPLVAGVPNKRLDVLVSAFVGLSDLHEQGWVLHVVGTCPDRSRPYLAELRARAAGAPVFFHPNASYEELTQLYSTSTLYWHAQGFGEDASDRPETQEHFGITTVEAMSAGAIPVVIDTAGPREVVEAVPGTGRWVTIDQLHAETRRLAALPDAEVADLSRRCQERAREFDPAHFRARLAEIVDTAKGEKDPEWLTKHPVLVLSPHLDDALFSASEIIRRGNVEVWTVFAGEPEPPRTTPWDSAGGFADSHAQMVTRWREDQAAFSGTSASIRHLPCLDGAYTTPERRAADLELLRREVPRWVADHADQRPVVVLPAGAGVPVPGSLADHAVKLASAPASLPAAAAPVVQQLKDLKHRAYLRRRRKAQRMGLAVNGDHLAVRDGMLAVLAADDRVTLVLAEDLPYLWWQPADAQVDAVAARSKLMAVPGSFEVDRQWKHDRISHYASQLDVMDAEHRRLSTPDTLPASERYWVLLAEGGVR
jgi:glycosyltransferase involved in cell wall biosynthesis